MASKPRNRPSVPSVLPFVRAVYARHCAGCCLHIVTDDGNTEQAYIDGCLQRALSANHADCIAAAQLLAQMAQTQRFQVCRRVP